MSFVIAYDTEEEAEIVRPPDAHVVELIDVDLVVEECLKDDTKKKEKKETPKPTPGFRK